MIYFVIIFALIFSNILFSFDEFKSDNGQLLGYMMNNKNWEESKTLKPPLPCKLIKLKIYFGGTIPTKDTLWISYDATDGYIPPSLFSRHIATLGNIIYDYDGKPGWKEFDVSNLNIRFGGTNGIVVQHLIKENGPFFGVDNQVQAQPNLTSFINNVFTPNPNFYNIRGTMYSITPGHYMVRSIVEYNNKNYNSEPTKSNKDLLIDVTKNSNLLNNNNFISSELSSICDLNNDGYDDIIIKNNFFVNKKDGNFERLNLNIPNNGIVSGDLDNDGFIDLFAVNGWGNDKIYWGTQSGTFIEETDNSIKVNAPTVSPLFLDYNNDGLLDIFIAYGRKEESGQETYYPDKLFKNLGNRKFVEVTNESGISKGEIPAMDCWGATITDFNNDGNEDSGDTKPSWWTVENGKPVKKMEFPFNSIKIPFNPAIDEQNGIIYIPHRNVIRSYDLDSFTWLDDNISNIDANSIDFAGGHLLIPKKYEDKPDSIVVLNLKNGMVLQKVYAGDEVIDVKYYPFVEDGKTKIGLAITTYIETLKSYVVLYGPIKHMQDFSLDNVELIEKPYRIHFSDNVLKIISKETGLIYNINVLDGEKEVLNFATNGEFGPSSLAVTDNEYLVSTYYGDVRSWDLLFKQLKNIYFVDGKVEHINYINSIENLILASPLTIDNKPNDKIYVLNEIISSVNDNYIHYPNLSIYPNPAFNYLNIEFDNVDYSNVIYKIYNINGAVLSEGKINNLNNIINIDDLSNGNYFLQIIVDNNKYYTIPFIKNK